MSGHITVSFNRLRFEAFVPMGDLPQKEFLKKIRANMYGMGFCMLICDNDACSTFHDKPESDDEPVDDQGRVRWSKLIQGYANAKTWATYRASAQPEYSGKGAPWSDVCPRCGGKVSERGWLPLDYDIRSLPRFVLDGEQFERMRHEHRLLKPLKVK